jgi:hypothetical protein
MIDDFEVCDSEILAIEGRSGLWDGDADADVTIDFGYSDPGAAFSDRTCAAWATGGALENGVETSYATIGFTLNGGAAYDVSSYLGLDFTLESDNAVLVVVETTGGGRFQYPIAAVVGSNPRSAPFYLMTKMEDSLEETLDQTTVSRVLFWVPDPPSTFGLAIHRVTFY